MTSDHDPYLLLKELADLIDSDSEHGPSASVLIAHGRTSLLVATPERIMELSLVSVRPLSGPLNTNG